MNRRVYRGARTSVTLALLALLTLGVGSGHARPVVRGDTVKISMYASSASQPALDVLIPSFEKANPGIDVSVTSPPTTDAIIQLETTQLAAGNAPDVLAVWPGCGTAISVCRLAPAGHLANMPNKPWARRSSSIAVSTSKYGGGLFVYSPAVTFEGLWTNDSLFESLGLKVPQTFPQLLDVCRKAKARATTPVILAASGSLVMQQLVGAFALTTVYAKDRKWLEKRKANRVTFAGTPGWRTALQKMIDLNNAGCYQSGPAGTTSGAAATQFAQGQALTYANMTSKKGEIQSYAPRFGFSQHPFPITGKPNGSTVMLIVGFGWSVNAHSSKTNQAAAQKLIDYLAQPKQSATYARVNGGLSQEQFNKGKLPRYLSSYARPFNAHKYGVNPVQKWWNAAVGNALTKYGTGLLTGQTSIDETLKAMDVAWQQGPD
jgi:raffinose/stachyose/melibiose transport system substrate-binding protein